MFFHSWNRQTYKCQLCTLITNQTVDVEHHTISIHVSKPVSLVSECCPFSAKVHINQKKHIPTIHTCDIYSFNSSFECHLSLHKDPQLKQDDLFTEQRFQSVYCGIIFWLKEHLKVHTHRRHSNQTQEGRIQTNSYVWLHRYKHNQWWKTIPSFRYLILLSITHIWKICCLYYITFNITLHMNASRNNVHTIWSPQEKRTKSYW